MFVYLAVDNRTMKRQWDFENCKDCLQRFECYTGDRITVKPDKLDLSESESFYVHKFKAEFHLPKCIRIGLFKQIADTGYWTRKYPTEGDGFKLGGILGDDEDEKLTIERSWIKLPNILYVTGRIR